MAEVVIRQVSHTVIATGKYVNHIYRYGYRCSCGWSDSSEGSLAVTITADAHVKVAGGRGEAWLKS